MPQRKKPEELPDELPRKKWWLPLLIGLVLLVVAIYGGRKLYGRLEPERLARRAQVLMDKRDYRGALITLSRALQINNNSESATRAMIELMERLQAPQTSEWHRRLSELNPNANDDAMAWAEHALKQGEPASAARALTQVPSENRSNPQFQSAAGLTAIQAGNLQAARAFFGEAAKLDPKSDVIRYNLALVQVQSHEPAESAAGMASLVELGKSGRAQSFALRTLVGQYARTGRIEEALASSNQLVSLPEAGFKDHLGNAELLRHLKRAEWTSSLEKAKLAAEEKPEDAAGIVNWYRINQQADEGLKWSEKLDPAVTDSPTVRSARAECLTTLARWDLLLRLARSDSWGPQEFRRYAYLARAQAEAGDTASSNGSWANAIRACYVDRWRLMQIAGMATSWGWKEQAREVLWVAAYAVSPDWALQQLYQGYSSERNTPDMLRVVRRMVDVDGSNLGAKNNVAVFSLLLQQNVQEALLLTQELVKLKPEEPIFRATYAFALLSDGRIEESLQAIEHITPELRADPAFALYSAMIYQANGDAKKAREYLAKIDRTKLLPEEERLAAKVWELTPS